MRSRPLAILLATTASIALGAPALAADASSAAASQSGAVPELVVTAQKREEALKNVPMAVAAVTFVVGVLLMPQTHHVRLWDEIQEGDIALASLGTEGDYWVD